MNWNLELGGWLQNRTFESWLQLGTPSLLVPIPPSFSPPFHLLYPFHLPFTEWVSGCVIVLLPGVDGCSICTSWQLLCGWILGVSWTILRNWWRRGHTHDSQLPQNHQWWSKAQRPFHRKQPPSRCNRNSKPHHSGKLCTCPLDPDPDPLLYGWIYMHIMQWSSNASIVSPPQPFYPKVDHLNAAQSMAKIDLLFSQVDYLVEQMHKDSEIDFENDWKMISVLIGANNLCECCWGQYNTTPAGFSEQWSKLVEKIYNDIPHVVVNVLALFNTSQVFRLDGDHEHCKLVHELLGECDCIFGKNSSDATRYVFHFHFHFHIHFIWCFSLKRHELLIVNC
jgi:hypothetical protein